MKFIPPKIDDFFKSSRWQQISQSATEIEPEWGLVFCWYTLFVPFFIVLIAPHLVILAAIVGATFWSPLVWYNRQKAAEEKAWTEIFEDTFLVDFLALLLAALLLALLSILLGPQPGYLIGVGGASIAWFSFYNSWWRADERAATETETETDV